MFSHLLFFREVLIFFLFLDMSPARWGHPGGCPPAWPASKSLQNLTKIKFIWQMLSAIHHLTITPRTVELILIQLIISENLAHLTKLQRSSPPDTKAYQTVGQERRRD